MVLILSATAWAAVSLLDTTDSRFRFEDTVNRLTKIREAAIGDPTLRLGNQPMLSGFIVDLGELPDELTELVMTNTSVPPALPRFEAQQPVFDPTPDGGGFNDSSGDEIVLDEDQEVLLNGYRGPYAQIPPGGDKLRDGWGNVGATSAEDDANHGWDWNDTTVVDQITITSTGANGDLGFDEGGSEGHVDLMIGADDWQADLAGWQIQIANQTANPLNNLRVAMLTYRLDRSTTPVGSRWQRFVSSRITSGIPAGDTGIVTFASQRVPIGEHLLVLYQDDDGTPTLDDSPIVSDGLRVTNRVRMIARTVLPSGVTLTVR